MEFKQQKVSADTGGSVRFSGEDVRYRESVRFFKARVASFEIRDTRYEIRDMLDMTHVGVALAAKLFRVLGPSS